MCEGVNIRGGERVLLVKFSDRSHLSGAEPAAVTSSCTFAGVSDAVDEREQAEEEQRNEGPELPSVAQVEAEPETGRSEATALTDGTERPGSEMDGRSTNPPPPPSFEPSSITYFTRSLPFLTDYLIHCSSHPSLRLRSSSRERRFHERSAPDTHTAS